MSGDLTDVLVVEDEPVVQGAAKRILGSVGLSVDLADDAEDAMDRLRERRYRVLVTDLMLPKASGFDLLEYASAEHPSLPVILITGYATLEIAIRAFRRGVFDLVPKPFDAEELQGVMHRAVAYAEHKEEASGRTAQGTSAEPREGGRRYGLGEHSWAELQADGSAVIGPGDTFADLFRDIARAKLPDIGDEIRQGDCLVRLVSDEDYVYRIWSPLSGQVVERNDRLEELLQAPGPILPQDAWLVRILPADLETEREALSMQSRPPYPAGSDRMKGLI